MKQILKDLEKLAQENIELKQENSELKNHLSPLQSQIDNCHSEKQAIRDLNIELQKNIDDLKDQLLSLDKDNNNLRNQLTVTQNEKQAIVELMSSSSEDQHRSLIIENSNLQQQISTLQTQYQESISLLQRKLEDSNKENHLLYNNIKHLQDQLSKATSINSNQELISTLQSTITVLQLDLHNLSEARNEELKIVNSLQQELEQAYESTLQNQSEIDELNLKNDQLQREIDKLKEMKQKQGFITVFRYFLQPETHIQSSIISPKEETEAIMNAVQVI